MKKQITEIHCSALARPMTCAGSLWFELPRTPTNAAAEEGTAAGEYLEHLLTGPANVEPVQAKNGVVFNDDIKFYINNIANAILKNADGDRVLCETKINWQTRSGIWIKGKYDVSYVKDGMLYIEDLKYGWTLVEVENNWQLISYAIGECLRRNQSFETIVLRIQQPRPHHEDGPVREWRISYDELLGFKEQIEVRMDQIASGFSELVTSTQCKYCPAACAACTAFNRAVFRGVDIVIGEATQDSINDEELAFQLDLMARVNDVLKIKIDSINELALTRIKEGKIIPGYLTETSYSDRKWKSFVNPLMIETLTNLNVVEKVLLSPAKCEKLGVPKELVKHLVERVQTGQKLVRKSAEVIGNKIFGASAPTMNKENV